MISSILFDRDDNERRLILEIIRDTIAYESDEKSLIHECSKYDELLKVIGNAEIQDAACLDISGKDGTSLAKAVRLKYPSARILLIADSSISPEEYISPKIMASALILRPYSYESVKDKIRGFYASIIEELRIEDAATLIIESKDGVVKVPYIKIYYFESCRKKIYVRLHSEEYGYYSTLEQLMEELPDDFVRCHRSFIINKRKVRSYNAAEGVIEFDDGTQIPVSRSYRKEIRDKIK